MVVLKHSESDLLFDLLVDAWEVDAIAVARSHQPARPGLVDFTLLILMREKRGSMKQFKQCAYSEGSDCGNMQGVFGVQDRGLHDLAHLLRHARQVGARRLHEPRLPDLLRLAMELEFVLGRDNKR